MQKRPSHMHDDMPVLDLLRTFANDFGNLTGHLSNIPPLIRIKIEREVFMISACCCDIIAEVGDHPASHRFPWDQTTLSYWPGTEYAPNNVILDAVEILERAAPVLAGKSAKQRLLNILIEKLPTLRTAFHNMSLAIEAYRNGQSRLDLSYRAALIPMSTRPGLQNEPGTGHIYNDNDYDDDRDDE